MKDVGCGKPGTSGPRTDGDADPRRAGGTLTPYPRPAQRGICGFTAELKREEEGSDPAIGTMARCRHHSGYLADDEAGHPTYVARVSGKPTVFPNSPQPPVSRPPRMSSLGRVVTCCLQHSLAALLGPRHLGQSLSLCRTHPPTPRSPGGPQSESSLLGASDWRYSSRWGAWGSGPQVV